MASNSIFFYADLFFLSSLVAGPSFMSISALFLEFSFVRDWLEIWKLEIPWSEFCPISGDWGELQILNVAGMSQIECYWMLQKSRITAFTVSELLRKNQLGGGVKLPTPTTTQIRVKKRRGPNFEYLAATHITARNGYQK